ncbi:MAG: hypothetical protein ACTS73_07805 [Arsenophonus sp. NEOnobi-MAG3]
MPAVLHDLFLASSLLQDTSLKTLPIKDQWHYYRHHGSLLARDLTQLSLNFCFHAFWK